MFNKRKKNNRLIPIEQRRNVIKVSSRKRRKRFSFNVVKWMLLVLAVLIVVSAGAAFAFLYSYLSVKRDNADEAVPELWAVGDGTYELRWPALGDEELYFVEVSTYTWRREDDKKVFFSGYLNKTSCQLPELPTDEGLILEIHPVKQYKVMGEEKLWMQDAPITRYFYIQDSTVMDLEWTADPDTATVSASFKLLGGNSCSIYVTGQDGVRRLLKTVEEDNVKLSFGEDGELQMPDAENSCILTFAACNRANGMAVYGDVSEEMIITREDFLNNNLQLSLNVLEDCICYMTWEETGGDYYEIQMKEGDSDRWKTVKQVSRDEERMYTSSRLKPFTPYSFRVVAVGGHGVGDGEYAAISRAYSFETSSTPVYCTVWPVKSLNAYSDAERTKVIAHTEDMGAYCVVDEENGMFGIYVDGKLCYVDSNYCMINLPEYLGGLCSYDITNSYASLFMAHDFEIPRLTDEVITGYEYVQMRDGSFLVPLLYPTAHKLQAAAEEALKKGYRLKIYDSFRPHIASVEMYQRTGAMVDMPIPEETYTGKVITDIDLYEYDEEGNPVGRITYWDLMNGDNSFILSNFVSAGVSKHNQGVALDLTLEDAGTRVELEMQTPMHDLSQFSAPTRNNSNAIILAFIMKPAGYNGIHSEWWHFQDDENRKALSLPCINKGVTPECWMTDGFGWRYRQINGEYAVDCTITINGTEYIFDSNGYVQN